MIWIEILSRHRDVTARFRIVDAEASIGRGYDNDVIVDDPYVAARHVRVFRDEGGQWIAEDTGSANGMFLDGGRARLARIVVDGRQPIRIGQTLLRIREAGHAVDPERLARPQWQVFPALLAAVLMLGILGVAAVSLWLGQTDEVRASTYLTPLLGISSLLLIWVGSWTLLSRIFSGRSRFLDNLLIALVGLLAFSLYGVLAQYAAYAWTWQAPVTYFYVFAWVLLAAAGFLHLRTVGRSRLWLKGGVVTVLLAAAIVVQMLQRSEAFSLSGRENTARLLLPPAFRAVPLQDETAFFGEIARLRAKLDADRSKARPGPAGG
ncbi:MAG: FHA domain-containing protein [Bradyrhizobium sp.]|uniref:FHA domain-containing protein n=1 Tax=Bradyrhizobium sp. TaxID=376 RepID=UPI001D2B038B|nr:FHA domain-containing protein [Bradyrhizobium sp.]MBV9562622.1 FHA domain-containing protein [Bradyrhizobium sp.]